MLEKMIAGDTTAIGSGSYANGRTLFRHFVHNVINRNHETVNAAYTKYIPDYVSKTEVLELIDQSIQEALYIEESDTV